MNHGLILPVLLPMFIGCLLLFGARLSMPVKRTLSLTSAAVLVPLSFWLMWQADQDVLQVYALGNWQAPFGIILLLDRLSALLLVATAVLAFFALLYATRGDDERGRNFHALFQFQLMGINGAFLTGDLFNLFVFFEILLIASYSLLLHGGGPDRVRAGLHYVILNLVGSALFLLAVGVLYGLTGTLNMADMAVRVAAANADQAPLLGAAGMLLLLVFGLKAAFLPLYFWLPRAYASATAPVAALFAIMTKVGLYSILRVYTLIFGDDAGMLANMAQEWLWPLSLLTIGLGVIGALAASSLHGLLAYLVVVSVGTVLAGISLGTPQALAAALFYLLHSTWIAGGLFLLADLIARQRGVKTTQLIQGAELQNPHLLGPYSSSERSVWPACRRCPGSSASCCCCGRSSRACRHCSSGRWCWSAAWPPWSHSVAPAAPCSGGSVRASWTAPNWTPGVCWPASGCCCSVRCWSVWPRLCWPMSTPRPTSCWTCSCIVRWSCREVHHESPSLAAPSAAEPELAAGLAAAGQ